MLRFIKRELGEFTLIHVELDGIMEPGELKDLKPPAVRGDGGVVLSGRAPIWLYSFLVHHYHPTRWIGIYDPRIGGAVVVASHWKEKSPGDVVPIDLEAVLQDG